MTTTLCTLNDLCDSGECAGMLLSPEVLEQVGLLEKCACQVDEDCAPIDDGNVCNGVPTCQPSPELPELLLCQADPDTVVDCDDGIDCTEDSCVAETGECVFGANDALCSDGNACDGSEICDLEEGCLESLPLECDDGDLCNGTEVCDWALGCVPGTPLVCDDGNPCDGKETCDPAEGCQAGVAPDCNDNNPCTTDKCDVQSGCVNEPNSLPCDDGNDCTQFETCSGGLCVGGFPLNCNDNNPCTDDTCDPDSGCHNDNNLAGCNDNNVCTTGDYCQEGGCVGGPALDCSDNNPCTDDSCTTDKGCQYAPNDDSCDDGNKCTTEDQCEGGSCVAGGLKECNDFNACTDDTCNPATGCATQNNTSPCDDANVCTLVSACEDGSCVGSNSLDCGDGNQCTDDYCHPQDGCQHVNISAPCDDNSTCTTGDICVDGECVGQGTLKCDDNNPCTLNICAEQGKCEYTPIDGPCSDDNPCTVGDQCQAGDCQAGQPMNCDDLNPCTDDSCDAQGSCQHLPNTAMCNDSNACTLGDTCSNKKCIGASILDCDDENPCTNDSCDPQTGCIHANNDNLCDDGNACTPSDKCSQGNCVGSGQKPCDDGNSCTNDSCDPALGCVNAPNTKACDDGSACTTNDKCSGGSCEGGPGLDCDDGNICTSDSCAPASGCVNEANKQLCNDGNACTEGDVCENKTCIPGTAIDCDDGKVCTNDACSPDKGCVYTNNQVGCDDGNECTTVDKCSGGACQGGSALDCDDGNECTDDGCNPLSGCVSSPNSQPCDDDDDCTIGDTCAGGSCKGGEQEDCSDDNVCTTDYCLKDGGCQNDTNDFPCDDDDPCTVGDACGGGQCQPEFVDAGCQSDDDWDNDGIVNDEDACPFAFDPGNPDANGIEGPDACEGLVAHGTFANTASLVLSQDGADSNWRRTHEPAEIPLLNGIVDSSVAGYWKFDGNADDATGYNLSTNYGAQPTMGVFEDESGAMQFDGVDDYVDTGHKLSLTSEHAALTMMAWIRLDSSGEANTYVLAYRDYTAESTDSVWLGIAPGGQAVFRIQMSGGGKTSVFGDSAVGVNKWHHLAAVYSDNQLSVYVDGRLGGFKRTEFIGSLAGGCSLYVGARHTLGGDGIDFSDLHFAGAIDEAMLFNRALSPDEVSAHYHSHTPYGTDLVPGSQADFDDVRVTEKPVGQEPGSEVVKRARIVGPRPHSDTPCSLGQDDGSFAKRDDMCGVKAYLRFNGNGDDVAGNHAALVYGAGYTTGRFGDAKGALEFKDGAGYADLSDTSGLSMAEGTWELWVRPDACDGSNQAIINKNKQGDYDDMSLILDTGC